MKTSDLIRLLADNPNSTIKAKLKTGKIYTVSGVSFDNEETIIHVEPDSGETS